MTKSLFVAAALAATAFAVPAAAQMPAGNAAAGEKVFAQCKTCHVVEKGVNRVGPSLHGVVGRKSGTAPGFKYSAANLKSGVTWTAPVLFQYLEAPMKFMPGTKMAFGGLKKPQDRADVIAFLATKK
jgi:cytochrome c